MKKEGPRLPERDRPQVMRTHVGHSEAEPSNALYGRRAASAHLVAALGSLGSQTPALAVSSPVRPGGIGALADHRASIDVDARRRRGRRPPAHAHVPAGRASTAPDLSAAAPLLSLHQRDALRCSTRRTWRARCGNGAHEGAPRIRDPAGATPRGAH